MTKEPIPASVHLALVAVQLMFASLAIVGKIALRELSPFGLIAARVTAATLVLVTAHLLMRSRERLEPRDMPEVALYALFGVTANMLLFIAGLQRTTATNAVVIGAIIPVFTVGVAVALRKEAATLLRVAGLAVACIGAMVVVGAGRFEGGGTRLVGNLFCVCNSLSFSIYLVISRRLLAKYRPMTLVVWTFVFGTLGILPFGAPGLVAAAPHLSTKAWICIAYIVLFPTVGTYFLNMFALKRAPASLVAIYIYVQPVVGALLAAAALGERPSPSTFVGGALIACGIALVTHEARRARAALR
ncbi:MAG: Permease of the drug/metabolite transporter superfamily [Myxococcales bacterium]|nr:Permease of the drug/metabolite transporter superfamily [Myxococcales bacterium]